MTAVLVPDDVVRWVARAVTGREARVVAIDNLRPAGSPWLVRFDTGAAIVLKSGQGLGEEVRTEAAALSLCEQHGLLAPRLLAVDTAGTEAGAPALAVSVLEGSADIPVDASPARLRCTGAAAAGIHQVPLQPCADLPERPRHMPWIDLSAERRRGDAPTTPLLDAVDEALAGAASGAPDQGPMVFVHADLWAGNTMWVGDEYAGTIDWEAAGCGRPGVDLGSLRLDAALLHGEGAADHVLAGWEEAAGERLDDVAWWDVVAAANTSADMEAFTPTMHDAGRVDLDGPTLAARRDTFLANALERLR